MRRVVLAFISTVAALVLLLSFKTHNTSALTTPPAIGGPGLGRWSARLGHH